jgi:hypothetical protein
MQAAKSINQSKPQEDAWVLRLYVAGQTPKSKKSALTTWRISIASS